MTGDIRAEAFKTPDIPGVDALCFSLECALPEDCIVDPTARDTGLGRAASRPST
jgi:hypothetical protein